MPIPSWWVPVKWPASGLSPAATAPTPAPTTTVVSRAITPTPTAVLGFLPLHFTNRPTGLLVGAVKPLDVVKQPAIIGALALAKNIIGTVRTAVSATVNAAAAAGSAAASSVAESLPAINTAVAAITTGISAWQLSEAKGRAAKEEAGLSLAQSIVSFMPGLGLIGIASAAEGLTDAANAKKRARRVLVEYQVAVEQIQTKIQDVVRSSDRLDAFYLLAKSSREQIVTWCKDSVGIANVTLQFAADMSKPLDVVGNGQDFIGIPGRDVSQLRALVDNAVRDALILYFASRDMCMRLGVPVAGGPWPSAVKTFYAGSNSDTGSVAVLQFLANFAGVSADNRPGIVPRAQVSVDVDPNTLNLVTGQLLIPTDIRHALESGDFSQVDMSVAEAYVAALNPPQGQSWP